MSLDYIIYGKTANATESLQHSDEVTAIVELINSSPSKKQQYALSLLKLFLNACSSPVSDNDT